LKNLAILDIESVVNEMFLAGIGAGIVIATYLIEYLPKFIH
jgi:hypothetical protein